MGVTNSGKLIVSFGNGVVNIHDIATECVQDISNSNMIMMENKKNGQIGSNCIPIKNAIRDMVLNESESEMYCVGDDGVYMTVLMNKLSYQS